MKAQAAIELLLLLAFLALFLAYTSYPLAKKASEDVERISDLAKLKEFFTKLNEAIDMVYIAGEDSNISIIAFKPPSSCSEKQCYLPSYRSETGELIPYRIPEPLYASWPKECEDVYDRNGWLKIVVRNEDGAVRCEVMPLSSTS